MKPANWMIGLFAAAVAVQLAVPASMIARHERTLRTGQLYKFKTAPVDPYDAFRGRYVALGFEQNQAPAVPPGTNIGYNRPAYALLETGPDGFARFTGVTLDRPKAEPYLKVRTLYASGTNLTFVLPFDRFYMEESLAPKAETAYREHSRRGQQDAYVTVRVRDGLGVIENLYVAGQPIAEFIKAQP